MTHDRPKDPWLVVVKDYPVLDEVLGRHFFIDTSIAATSINTTLQRAIPELEQFIERLVHGNTSVSS